MANASTRVVSHLNQDSAVEMIEIKKLIKEADLHVMLTQEQGCCEVRQAFHLSPGLKLTQACDAKAKKVRTSAETKEMCNNIRCYEGKLTVKDG